jgi:calcineurin-like phosphoesterase family protein
MTSDTHFGHVNIIKYCNRPYGSVDAMNEDLVRLWNETVGPNDIVIHLGDVAMGRITQTLALVRHLNGHKHLIAGNHDRCYYKPEKVGMYLEAGFETVSDTSQLVLGDRIIDLIHLPFPHGGASHEGDRSAYERSKLRIPEDTRRPLLCGHVHNNWKTMRSLTGTPMANVGIDVHGLRPVSLEWAARAVIL